MPNAIKWEAAAATQGNVLTTELNSLADNAISGVGTAIDNSANLDQFGYVEVNLASLNPTTGAFLTLYMTMALDGTNYEDPAASTNPAWHAIAATIPVTTGSATKRCMSPKFEIPPCKVKFQLRNDCNVALAASGNTVELFTTNDEVQ